MKRPAYQKYFLPGAGEDTQLAPPLTYEEQKRFLPFSKAFLWLIAILALLVTAAPVVFVFLEKAR